MTEVKITETQLVTAQQCVEDYYEAYAPKEEVEKVKRILRSESENVLPKSRFRKGLRL